MKDAWTFRCHHAHAFTICAEIQATLDEKIFGGIKGGGCV